jgi:Rrf2 family transcriptional regulator, iron-sulfur cluster assembly transcription factor
MSITTKGKYAVMSLVYLAQQSLTGVTTPITLLNIAKAQEIDLRYLEQIFAKLRRSGLVAAARGPRGGYTLLQDPNSISLFDILNVFGENIDMTRCGSSEIGCVRKKRCNSHDLWASLNDKINNLFKNVSLAEISKGHLTNYIIAEHGQYIS